MYKLKYLPLAQKDLRDITSYISDILKAPKAAMDLVDTVDNSTCLECQAPNFLTFSAVFRQLPRR